MVRWTNGRMDGSENDGSNERDGTSLGAEGVIIQSGIASGVTREVSKAEAVDIAGREASVERVEQNEARPDKESVDRDSEPTIILA